MPGNVNCEAIAKWSRMHAARRSCAEVAASSQVATAGEIRVANSVSSLETYNHIAVRDARCGHLLEKFASAWGCQRVLGAGCPGGWAALACQAHPTTPAPPLCFDARG